MEVRECALAPESRILPARQTSASSEMLGDPADPYAIIAQRLGGRLSRRWTLEGGVSAQVCALELAMPDGTTERVVVRQHGAATWKPLEEGVTSTEYALLEVLADAGLPVPRPRLLDLSGTVLPAPYLVLPFVDGTTEPRMPASAAVERMAGFLARLHGLDVASRPIPPALPRRAHPMPELLEYLDAGQEELRRLLEGRAAEPVVPLAESVLHGDFWPGNVLWREHEMVAVIDWEDAAVGDPLSDLACCRVELACAYGEAAMEAFMAHYLRTRDGAVDRERLALWELYVSSAALASMDQWGLEPPVLASRRSTTSAFLERAARLVLDSGGR